MNWKLKLLLNVLISLMIIFDPHLHFLNFFHLVSKTVRPIFPKIQPIHSLFQYKWHVFLNLFWIFEFWISKFRFLLPFTTYSRTSINRTCCRWAFGKSKIRIIECMKNYIHRYERKSMFIRKLLLITSLYIYIHILFGYITYIN